MSAFPKADILTPQKPLNLGFANGQQRTSGHSGDRYSVFLGGGKALNPLSLPFFVLPPGSELNGNSHAVRWRTTVMIRQKIRQ
jgi:hypothetical protein